MEIFKYKYDELFNPVLQALHLLGGSGTNDEIEEKLVEVLGLSNDAVEDIDRGNTTKLSYRTAWAKNYLKRLGLLERLFGVGFGLSYLPTAITVPPAPTIE